jgi:hypothetical protein
MNLDIRMPIGIYFTGVGFVLVIQGLIHPLAGAEGMSEWNLNLYWGLVMGVFGVIFLVLSRKKR